MKRVPLTEIPGPLAQHGTAGVDHDEAAPRHNQVQEDVCIQLKEVRSEWRLITYPDTSLEYNNITGSPS